MARGCGCPWNSVEFQGFGQLHFYLHLWIEDRRPASARDPRGLFWPTTTECSRSSDEQRQGAARRPLFCEPRGLCRRVEIDPFTWLKDVLAASRPDSALH